MLKENMMIALFEYESIAWTKNWIHDTLLVASPRPVFSALFLDLWRSRKPR